MSDWALIPSANAVVTTKRTAPEPALADIGGLAGQKAGDLKRLRNRLVIAPLRKHLLTVFGAGARLGLEHGVNHRFRLMNAHLAYETEKVFFVFDYAADGFAVLLLDCVLRHLAALLHPRLDPD